MQGRTRSTRGKFAGNSWRPDAWPISSSGDAPSKSTHAEQGEPLPYNHHLQEFLNFLKQERGFAEATIVKRKHSLKPFLAWLAGQGVPLSTVSPVVITKYFTGAVAGKWQRTSVSFHVQSLRSFFRYAGWRHTLETARTHVWPSNRGLAKLPASGRAGQPIGLSVAVATNVGDREIERPGQFPADPIQGIKPRTAAAVLTTHLLDHYFGI